MIEIKATEELSLKNNKGDYDVYVEDVSVEYGQDTVGQLPTNEFVGLPLT